MVNRIHPSVHQRTLYLCSVGADNPVALVARPLVHATRAFERLEVAILFLVDDARIHLKWSRFRVVLAVQNAKCIVRHVFGRHQIFGFDAEHGQRLQDRLHRVEDIDSMAEQQLPGGRLQKEVVAVCHQDAADHRIQERRDHVRH